MPGDRHLTLTHAPSQRPPPLPSAFRGLSQTQSPGSQAHNVGWEKGARRLSPGCLREEAGEAQTAPSARGLWAVLRSPRQPAAPTQDRSASFWATGPSPVILGALSRVWSVRPRRELEGGLSTDPIEPT